MEIKINEGFGKSVRRLKLNILTAGYGEIEKNWGDDVINTPYSRLYFIIDGEFHIITDSGKLIEFQKGNAYLIPAGSSYRFGCKRNMKHVYFHLQLCSSDKIDLLGDINEPISVGLAESFPFENLVSLTLSENYIDNFKAEAEVRKTLCDMLFKNGITLEENEYSPEIKCAIEYISKNLSVDLGISDICEKINLAPSTLTRKFRKETGMSVGEYIDKLIMFGAERALLSTDASILEISEEFGFCDQFYFSRRFKEKYGISPREYRKKTNV